MAKTISKIMGVVFILVGIVGFLAPGMMGFHLNLAHNLIHLVSGALALYFGFAATLSAARLFCIVFGVVYGLLGVADFLLGHSGAHGAAGVPAGHHGTADSNLLAVLPGTLELASVDHIFHILLAIIFLAGGFLTRAGLDRAVDQRPGSAEARRRRDWGQVSAATSILAAPPAFARVRSLP